MTHDDTGFAAEVLNNEIAATRGFLNKVQAGFLRMIGLSGDSAQDETGLHGVYEDLYYPHEKAQRS